MCYSLFLSPSLPPSPSPSSPPSLSFSPSPSLPPSPGGRAAIDPAGGHRGGEWSVWGVREHSQRPLLSRQSQSLPHSSCDYHLHVMCQVSLFLIWSCDYYLHVMCQSQSLPHFIMWLSPLSCAKFRLFLILNGHCQFASLVITTHFIWHSSY